MISTQKLANRENFIYVPCLSASRMDSFEVVHTEVSNDIWTSNILKGRIAEAIVEEMLKEAGFQVYRFGYESIIQNLTQIDVQLKETEIARKIKSIPDFIVIKEGLVDFVEVKFRSGRPYHKRLAYKYIAKNWPESQILFVCKTEPHFRIANICDFVEKNYLCPLEKYNDMVVRENIVDKFSKHVIASYDV